MLNEPSAKHVGVAMAILGVVLFSTKAVMVKLAYTYGVDHVTLLLFRMGFALPFYVIVVLWKAPQYPAKIKGSHYVWIIFFGFIGYYLASLFDFMGLQYVKAGLERIILFCYPTLVLILSWLFFGKRITKMQLTALVLTYIGIVVVFWEELHVDGASVFWGGFLIFLSALTYASYLVGSGWLIPKFGVLQFTSYAMIVSTGCVFLHYSIVGNFDFLDYPWQVYALGLAMAVFATLIPSFLVSAAIERLGATTFSLFGSLGPISTILLAYLFLDEGITPVQLLGMFIVILGVRRIAKE